MKADITYIDEEGNKHDIMLSKKAKKELDDLKNKLFTKEELKFIDEFKVRC